MFRTIRVIIAAAALCVAASPLAAKPKIDLSQQPLAERMQVEIRMPQQEIIAESSQTNAMMFGGGLLGALIAAGVDNKSAKKAEGAIGPFRDKLVDTDWQKVAREAIEQGLSRDVFAPELAFSFHTTMSYEDRKAKTLAEGRRILVIVPSYAFTAQFTALKVRLDAAIVDRRIENGRLRETVLYSHASEYNWVLDGWTAKAKRPARIEAWQAVDGAQLDALLHEGFTGAVAMLNEQIAKGYAQRVGRVAKEPYPGAQATFKAKVVAVDGTRKTYYIGPYFKGSVDVVP
ncbi:MAG TPA: hypothetical protein VFL14_15805 [Xanthomonadales bacterium]|nr:hypothetical protein [Xanthomonadales bacterium]